MYGVSALYGVLLYFVFEKFSTEIGSNFSWCRTIVTLCGELWQKLAAIGNTNCDGNDPQVGVAFIYRCRSKVSAKVLDDIGYHNQRVIHIKKLAFF